MLLNGRGRGGVLSPMTAGSVGIGRVFIFFVNFDVIGKRGVGVLEVSPCKI